MFVKEREEVWIAATFIARIRFTISAIEVPGGAVSTSHVRRSSCVDGWMLESGRWMGGRRTNGDLG